MSQDHKDHPEHQGISVYLDPRVPLEIPVQMALMVLQAPRELVDPEVRRSLEQTVAMAGIASSLALLDRQVRAEILDPSLRDLLDKLDEMLSSLEHKLVP